MSDRITLRIDGLMLERLLNRALAEGACFHKVIRQNRRRLLLVSNGIGAAIVLALTEKYHLNCRIVRKSGIRPILSAMRKRPTLPAAVLVCALCTALFLSRIWFIDVEFVGSHPTNDPDALKNALATLGVRPGIPRRSVDPDLLSLRLAAQTEDLSFVGVQVQGVRLLVKAACETEAPEVYDPDCARDLVAVCDGVIVSVDAKCGRACVVPGETVRRGQVLIRGEERISAEETRGVAALGEVIARTWFSAGAEAPLTGRVREYTGRESVSSVLRIRKYCVSLDSEAPLFPAEVRTEIFPIGGIFLPAAIERTTLLEYTEKTVRADKNSTREALASEALARAAENMQAETGGACQIIDKWVDYSMIDADRLRARAVLEVQRNIAATRDALYQGGN